MKKVFSQMKTRSILKRLLVEIKAKTVLQKQLFSIN